MTTNSSTDRLIDDIRKYVSDARWPVTKPELLEWAERSRATTQVMDAINDMSSDRFYSIDDVVKDYVDD